MIRSALGASLLAIAAAAASAGAAHASPLLVSTASPVSYSMPNGEGQAVGGYFNYWDNPYSGQGCSTCDLSPLSGGKGQLTDGVIATDHWNNVENVAGTGPYVMWLTVDPVIHFTFTGNPTITDIVIDSDTQISVLQSGHVKINGVDYATTDIFDGDAPTALAIAGLNFTGNELDLQLFRPPGNWVGVSEIKFNTGFSNPTTDVAEPGSLSLAALGFGLVGLMSRGRRRTAPSVALGA